MVMFTKSFKWWGFDIKVVKKRLTHSFLLSYTLFDGKRHPCQPVILRITDCNVQTFIARMAPTILVSPETGKLGW